jgi:protein-tyrosine phosphatase
MSDQFTVAARVVPLRGGHNFREVAGYPTNTGQQLRRGMLWRSAGLDRLSEHDCQQVLGLGIRTIADLRTDRERDLFRTPSTLSDNVRTLTWTSHYDDVPTSAASESTWRDMDPAVLRREIAKLYTRIAEAHAVQLSDLYMAIAEHASPILIHCTAGKDRTGIAIAILLELVGVTRESVLHDYEQTNIGLKKHMVNLESAVGVGATANWMAALGPDGRNVLLEANRAYLIATLADIEQRFGSVQDFALKALALSDSTLDRLRSVLIEPQAPR